MALRVTKWIGSNGEILIPLTYEAENNGKMISTKGTYFIPLTEEVLPAIVAGNPMGLLLTLTYPATP